LPVRGEIVHGPGLFEFEVLDADPRRVKRVRITRLKERRDQPREARRRVDTDNALAGVAPSSSGGDGASTSKDAGPEAGARRL
jgi:Transporter associated domain